MRPVGAPDRAVGRRLDECFPIGNRVVPTRLHPRVAIAVGHHHPPILLLQHVEYPTDHRPVHPTLEPDVATMFDDHRHAPDRTQQIRIVEQVVPTHVQPRVPTELFKSRHRASHLRLALIEGKKADEIESCTSYTGKVQSLQLLVRNAVVDNPDATIAVPILQAFEGMQQESMVAAVYCAMDNDATREADRLMHFLRFGEGRAFDRRVGWILPRRKLRRVLVYMKLTIATSRWWRRHWHPRLSVPLVEFLSGLRHSHLLCPWYSLEGFWSPNLTFGAP